MTGLTMNARKAPGRWSTTIGMSLAVVLLVSTSAGAGQDTEVHDPHARHRAMMAAAATAEADLTDVDVSDQLVVTRDGESVRFSTDVIAGRILVIDFVYTTCTTVCPITSAIFAQVQESLGTRLGDEVIMVSMSVDPGRDTPQRLKAYADGLNAGPGWMWLTGAKPAVDQVLRGLGAYTPNFEDHPAMVLVGDERTGKWKRFFGFPAPAKILAAVDELQNARLTASTQR